MTPINQIEKILNDCPYEVMYQVPLNNGQEVREKAYYADGYLLSRESQEDVQAALASLKKEIQKYQYLLAVKK